MARIHFEIPRVRILIGNDVNNRAPTVYIIVQYKYSCCADIAGAPPPNATVKPLLLY